MTLRDMLAFLLITFCSAPVLGDTWMKSDITTAINADSGSLSLGLDLEWGSRISKPSTSQSETTSTTSEPMTIVSVAATGPTSYTVDVGAMGDTVFVPNQLNASVGDVIHFRFLKLNHTLTQSTLEDPCTSTGSFDTGFQFFNPLNQTNKTLNFVVTNTDPTWFFCHQTIDIPHCKNGMVFGLNPAGRMNQFLANAKSFMVGTAGSYYPTGTAGSYYPTGSAVSLFPTGGTLTFPALPSGLKSVPPGVFYTGYAGTTGGSEGHGTSSTATSSTTTSHIVTATSDGITTSTIASSLAPQAFELSFQFYAFLMVQLFFVVV